MNTPKIPPKQSETRTEDTQAETYRMEYEQTVQTLRNWDTLFFNAGSSILISGGISSIAVIASKQTVGVGSINSSTNHTLGYVVIAVIAALIALFICYLCYIRWFASPKIKTLGEIERRLGMVGVYGKKLTHEKARRG